MIIVPETKDAESQTDPRLLKEGPPPPQLCGA
jgi:hypothetical protein